MSQSYGIDWQPVGYSVTMYDYIYSDGTKCSAKEAFQELFIKKLTGCRRVHAEIAGQAATMRKLVKQERAVIGKTDDSPLLLNRACFRAKAR